MSAKELVIGLCMSAVLAFVAQGGPPRPRPLPIGDKAPDFKLVQLKEDGTREKDVTRETFDDSELLVVCFTCIRCPVSRAYEDRFNKFVRDYRRDDVAFVAIDVNGGESAEMIKSRDREIRSRPGRKGIGFEFPYLYDASGESAKSYRATITPELFVFDKARKLVYHGAFDDSLTRPSRHYVRDAVDRVLEGHRPLRMQTTPYGTPIRPQSR